jgi:hypothetical protein
MMTHEAVEGAMQKALGGIKALDAVTGKTICLRVEEA